MTLRRPGQAARTPRTGPHRPRGPYDPPGRHDPPGPPESLRSQFGLPERRSSRTGTEPVTARSALGVRLILAVIFTPVFLAATALFWYWTTQTGPGDVPGVDSLRTLTVICGALALFSLVDLMVVVRRRRRQSSPR
ncbi:MAG TPA: DUF6343 family protein [Streptomyces sp.]|nr:DUF6343 family protein [Streptomyces sp.]